MNWKEAYAAKENEAKHEHRNKYRRNMNVIEKILGDDAAYIKKYPRLMKRCVPIARYLDNFVRYSRDKIIGLHARNDDGFMFFGSVRHLSRTMQYGDKSSWSRNINLLAALGFVVKVPLDQIPKGIREKIDAEKEFQKRKMKKSEIREINFYVIPDFSKAMLDKAEEIAKKMKETGFRLNSMNRLYFLINFGEDFAKKVFPNEQTQVSKYSEYVAHEIATYMLNEIDKKGYVTPSEIWKNVMINTGNIGDSRRVIVNREFDRRKKEIIDTYGLTMQKANKELMETFKLTGYILIIYKA